MANGNTANSKKTAKPRGKPFQNGHDPRRNLAGRPALGESWREIFDKAGKLTKQQLLDLYPVYGKRLVGLPEDVSLRDAVALSALVTLACEPSPGLLSAIMERVDGKVAQPVTFESMTEEQKINYVRGLLAASGFVLREPETEGLSSQADGAGTVPVDTAPDADAAAR